jgi:hypothetical protein
VLGIIRRLFDPLKNTVEALDWLRDNPNEAALGCNRFHSTEKAIRFVQSLYDAGAEAVAIPRDRVFAEPWRIAQDGGPYTETLLVKLSSDPEKRRAVWRICDEEYRQSVEDWEPSPPDYLPSAGVVHLWWS